MRDKVSRIIKNTLIVKTAKPIAYVFIFFGLIPKAIWFLGAIFGIFIFGVFMGMEYSEEPNELNRFEVVGKDAEYYDLIRSYEDLNKKYYKMLGDMEVLTDVSRWEEEPERVYDAVEGYKDNRDQIIFEQGIIYEKRQQAGLDLPVYSE